MRSEYDFSKGRRGAAVGSPGKTRITIMLDDDVIEAFRARAEARGIGYQTAINEALRRAIGETGDEPVSTSSLRSILREELAASRKG